MNGEQAVETKENGSGENKQTPQKEYPLTFTGKSFGEVHHIVNADGLYLFCKYWKPEKEVTGLVCHLHGYAEHCARSEELAKKLAELGLYSFAHDHIGHGESQGLRGHITDYTVMVRDAWQHIDIMKSKYPDVPMFLYGHSMGGALAIFTAQERPDFFRGVLLSAPFISPSPETATPLKTFMAKVLSRILPKLRLAKLDQNFLSRDQNQIKAYVEDPLNDCEGMRVSTAVQLLTMAENLEKCMPSVKWPMFIAHSESDQICDIGGSKVLFEVSNSKDKTFKVYSEPLHMLEHETPDFVESYFTEVTDWIKERLSTSE